MKNVVVLGSTGSIGTSTIKVAEDLPDRIRLLALAAGNNSDLLIEQTRKHQPAAVCIKWRREISVMSFSPLVGFRNNSNLHSGTSLSGHAWRFPASNERSIGNRRSGTPVAA